MSILSFLRRERPARNRPAPPRRRPDGDSPADQRSSGRDWGRLRINLVVILFAVLWAGLWARAWHLQMVEGPRLADRAERQHTATELVAGRRGVIFDRGGQVLARSVEALSVYANPHEIRDPLVAANTLGPLLDVAPQKLYDEFVNSRRRFIWIRRKVDDATARAVRKAGLAGIGLSREYDRIYPFKHMAGQLLGFVGLDDTGLEGLERSLESRLGAAPTRRMVQRDAMGRRFYHDDGRPEPRGEDVTLTIDMQLQYLAEQAVASAAREYDARWAGALLVDIPTGEILAWAQYPFFNPNLYKDASPAIYRNRLAADALEPGSTLKPLIMAAAMQEKKISPSTPIDCEGGRWETKKHVIRDTSIRGVITASKVIRYSSNIGMAKIGLDLGPRTMYEYLRRLGFGERTPVPVAETRGILRPVRDWSEIDTMAAAFGQSISASCLQMAQAYLILLNNGVARPLRLIRERGEVDEIRRRVFDERVSRQVMQMMRDVVEEKDGTGRRAHIDGVEVGGKTGTAQKADLRTGEYGAKRSASFVGFAPADRPRYFIIVMVDEPTRNQYGGVSAALAFKEIAERAMTWSGIMPGSRRQDRGDDLAVSPRPAPRARGLRPAQQTPPWLADSGPRHAVPAAPGSMRLPGHLARAGGRVPDVKGKSVRNAVEMFARAGIVPEIKGSGARVIRQSPPPGVAWPNGEDTAYILWLSEK